MKKEYYVYELEANDKLIFHLGEWENLSNLTTDKNLAIEEIPIGYGEIRQGIYIELFKK